MLQRLYIKNYVIIDELTLEFDEHLNVMTGETGAGKSIIAGALSLILGDRADTSVLIDKDRKCLVEATFDVKKNPKIKAVLEAAELDETDELIIRREINAKGKSRAFVNDTPVVLSVLNQVSERLVDLHRQFDQYLFDESNFEQETLDVISENQQNLTDYQYFFKNYQMLSRKFKDEVAKRDTWQKESDYKKFLFAELEEASFKEDELEEAERSLQKLNHAGQIKQILQTVHFNLEEAEPALNNELRTLGQQLESVFGVFPKSGELAKRIESVRLELKDIAEECRSLGSDLELDEDQLKRLQDRLDLGNRLLKKHQVQGTNELIKIQEELAGELSAQSESDSQIEQLEKQKNEALKTAQDRAEILHQYRNKKSLGFAKEVNDILHLIGMPNATFKINLDNLETLSETGGDQITFLWDANKSGQFKAVQKSASGGELSRIMLCIKALTAEAISLPTLVFDEVDTGISGEAARQVGMLLQKLSNKHQVICITHQPQIAGRGNTHFFVYKMAENKQVKTHVKVLSPEERIRSIAQMIGGEYPSDAALKSAKEMVAG